MPPTLVEIWEAQPQTISQRLEAVGTLVGNESVVITAKVTAQVQQVLFEDGQPAQRGQVLVELDDTELHALREEAVANLTDARLQLQRFERLGEDISTAAQIDLAQANVSANEARVAAIEARIADHRIRAPFDGVLGFRQVSTGALVTPGTVITELDDVSRLKLDFNVPETQLASLAVGNPIEASSSAWPGVQFTGDVVSLGNRVDPVTRTVPVRALIDNRSGRLRPGMLLNVSLQTAERTVLLAPESALIQTGNRSMLYLIDAEGKAQLRPVLIGKRMAGGVIIESGLAAGEQVVVTGHINLRPGSKTRVVATVDPVSEGEA
jgi:membrane fusion protein (multidrug efflux system)